MSDQNQDTLAHLDTATRSAILSEEFSDRVAHVPGLTIGAHPDASRVGEESKLIQLTSGLDVELSRLGPSFAHPGEGRLRPLADPHLSRRGLQLSPMIDGGIELRGGEGLRVQANGEPVGQGQQFSAAEIEAGVTLVLAERVVLILHMMELLTEAQPHHGLVGGSLGIRELRRQISRVSDLDVPVLIRGETGTGKELVAKAIHRLSRRRQRALVAINMGAVPATLAASELFGSVKGAFTGSERRRLGYFVEADGGTLFLDEIGETPSDVQPLLLRVLENGEIRAVGSESTQRVDVRVLAATDADLEEDIEEGRFRAPILHRLSSYEIRLPPLRRRREDIPRLLFHFLRQELAGLGEEWRLDKSQRRPWVPPSLVARLVQYDWPGNVRQLLNIARRLVIANRGARVLQLPQDLDQDLVNDPALFDRDVEHAIFDQEPPDTGPVPQKASDETGGQAVIQTLIAIRWRGCKIVSASRSRLDGLVRALLAEYDGLEVERKSGFLLVFGRPIDAVGFALELHEGLAELREELGEELGEELAAAVAIVLGEVFLRRNGPDAISRGARPFEISGAITNLSSALVDITLDGQTLLNQSAYDLTRQVLTPDHPLSEARVQWMDHGDLQEPDLRIFEVGLEGAAPFAAPPRGGTATEELAVTSYRSPHEIRESELVETLKRFSYRLQPTAKALKISRTSLYALIDKSSRIRKAKDLGENEIVASLERHRGDLDLMAAELEVSRKGLSRRMTQLKIVHPF